MSRAKPRFFAKVIVLVMPLVSGATDSAEPPVDVVRGKQLFMSVGCYECHGTQAAGGGMFGPRLAPDPLPTAAITAFVRHPRAGVPAYPFGMPAYSAAVLTDAQIADITAYLRSIPKGRAAADIPMLNH
jgi:mono/diheme cytochrome c family protein